MVGFQQNASNSTTASLSEDFSVIIEAIPEPSRSWRVNKSFKACSLLCGAGCGGQVRGLVNPHFSGVSANGTKWLSLIHRWLRGFYEAS